MAIRLEKLYKQARQNYQMQLIAGEAGLVNIINWVHMIEDEQVANFLRGNELVFTTGIGHPDGMWLSDFVQGLTRNKASGMVVNIGPYINAVPEPVIDYCKQHEFPLFTIPWQVRLVDITRDFCRRIINSEQAELSVSSAFKNAIFFPEKLPTNQAQLERRGFNVTWRYCVAVLAINSEQEDKHKENVAAIRFYAESIVNRSGENYSIFTHENRLTIIFAKFGEREITACINGIVDYYLTNGKPYKLHIGVGQNESGLVNISKSYKQAASVLHMAVKNNWHKVYYKDLGIYKILLSAEDDNVLREIYDDTLGRLLDYDVTHNTDYLNTLKCYLENDASIQAVAKLTFVHRNTINYKLNKIKEITGYDISSVEERLKIMLAFKIKDIL
ncbi:MAG: transcriptional regulator, PucR family [Anaerosporomusa subterranea]|nr:transcriptional regulator, PucR family [Anaerosporomusa subterranea]